MCLQKPFESELTSGTVTTPDSLFDLEETTSQLESPRDRLPDLGKLSKVSPRFKPLLVQLLSADAFTDAEFAGTLLDALGGYGEVHVIPGTSDYLLGLRSLGFKVKELIKDIEQSLDRARTWTKSLLWVYHLSGLDSSYLDTAPICRFLCKYTQLAMLHLGEKVLKYHLNYLFCKWSQQHDLDDYVSRECPPCDKDSVPGYLFGGRYDQYLRRKLFSNKDRFSSKRALLAYSIIQCKRMWPPISDQLQVEAVRKHRSALSGEGRNLVDLSPLKRPPIGRLSREVRRTVFEIFGPYESREFATSWSSPDKFVPSLSSHFSSGDLELNRKNGGAFGYFSEQFNPLCFTDLICMYYIPWASLSNKVIERRGLPRSMEISEYDHELMRGETLHADVHLVLEPAKARIITAGPPVAYHFLKPVQNKIWRMLKEHPTFGLIGGAKLQDVLPTLLKGEEWGADSVFVSADYSAATDNLNPQLIRVAAETISEIFGFSPDLENLYLKSLIGHTIHYTKEVNLPSVKQCWGQLMGSPSSFPILCIINAAVCRHVMELSAGRKMKLADSPLLINGDDAGFVLKQGDYEMWKETVSLAGLEPSLGKNYVSKQFIMLNSELHLARGSVGQSKPLEFRYVPFVNFGLISGQSKVLGDTRRDDRPSNRVKISGKVDEYDISSVAAEIVRGHTPEMVDKIISWFLVGAKDRIRAATFKKHPQSWFLPRSLGGLGIPSVRERHLTRGQAKLARYLSVCPAMDYELPGSLLQSPYKALYLTLAQQEENKIKDLYEKVWLKEGEEKLDLELNWKTDFTACRHEIQSRDDYVKEQIDLWNRLWKVGTDTSLEPMSWEESLSYKDKKVTLKRPGTSARPVEPACSDVHNWNIEGFIDEPGSVSPLPLGIEILSWDKVLEEMNNSNC